METTILWIVLAIFASIIILLAIKLYKKKKSSTPSKMKLISLGADKDVIEFIYSNGMSVCTTASTKIGDIVGLRIFFKATTINVNTLNSGQAFVHEIDMKTLAELLWEDKVIIPSLKNAEIICENIDVINRALSKLNKEEIPLYLPDGFESPTCFWTVDRNSKYFDEICKNPSDVIFEIYWQRIQKCLVRVELKSGEQQKTQNDYESTLLGIIYAKYDKII